jgi:hypothetical protein
VKEGGDVEERKVVKEDVKEGCGERRKGERKDLKEGRKGFEGRVSWMEGRKEGKEGGERKEEGRKDGWVKGKEWTKEEEK